MDDSTDLSPLARIAHEVAVEWGVDLGPPFSLSRHSYVAPAGEGAVLKVSPPDDDESDEEADALTFWDGDGAVRLLRCDRGRRALLIERAFPGSDISGLADEVATAIAIAVGSRLWRPAGVPFRWIGDHISDWLDEAEASGQAGRELIPLARQLYASLDVGRAILVHGDLHHHNILLAGDRHLAIDAKAMLGEPEYDIPSFLRNPLGSRMRLDATERRLAAFAAAGLDDARMRVWTVIRLAILGAEAHESRVARALLRGHRGFDVV